MFVDVLWYSTTYRRLSTGQTPIPLLHIVRQDLWALNTASAEIEIGNLLKFRVGLGTEELGFILACMT